MNKYDVVQFAENHKYCGNLGIIYEITELPNDTVYKVGVSTLKQKIKYIDVLKSEDALKRIGESYLYVRSKHHV